MARYSLEIVMMMWITSHARSRGTPRAEELVGSHLYLEGQTVRTGDIRLASLAGAQPPSEGCVSACIRTGQGA